MTWGFCVQQMTVSRRETQKWINQSTWGFGSIQIISGLKFCPKSVVYQRPKLLARNEGFQHSAFNFGCRIQRLNMAEGQISDLFSKWTFSFVLMLCLIQIKWFNWWGICKNMNLQKHCRLRLERLTYLLKTLETSNNFYIYIFVHWASVWVDCTAF